jgi:alpha-1,6-mannosyltransferase
MSVPEPTVRQLGAVHACGLAIWFACGLFALAIDDPRLRYPEHLLAVGVMGAAWLWSIHAAPTFSRRTVAIACALGLLLRIAAIFEAPAFSDDVFRYVYEGRVVWHRGLGFPFAHPPSEAPLLGVPAHLLDEAWLRINHPHITTIYPPLAQSVFVLAGGLGELLGAPLLWLKLLLVLADLGTWAIVAAMLRREGRPIALSLAWGLCPLILFEIAREGHADSLSSLGLALGIFAFSSARPRLGWIGFALAALAKLNGLVAMAVAARSTRRGLALGLLLASLLAIPFLLAGAQAGFAIGQYATRWRAGDGAFSLILLLADGLVGGEWRQLTESGFTITKHQVARAITASLGAGLALRVLWPPAPMEAIPKRAGLLFLLLLLLAPTLHPWYVAWILPFAVLEDFPPRRAILALAFLSPLLHHPGWLELSTGEWTDLGWVRALVHLPTWALLLAPRFRLGYRSSSCPSKKDS